jgi:hypothetical protein
VLHMKPRSRVSGRVLFCSCVRCNLCTIMVGMGLNKTLRTQLDKLPLTELKEYLSNRRGKLRSAYGRWGESKVPRKCPRCGKPVGARELRRHLRRNNSECPKEKK